MIIINRESKQPLYEQIYNQISQAIIVGELKSDAMLTPIRVLADELNVSKNTVDYAYRQLMAEGYIYARRGSGYYVESVETHIQELTDNMREDIGCYDADNNKYIYDFSHDSVSSEEFEWKKWKECINESLYEEEYHFDGYKDCRGDLSLRRSIASYIKETRGVRCGLEQIVICSGTLYALENASAAIRRYMSDKEELSVNCAAGTEDHVLRIFREKGFINMEDPEAEVNVIYVSPSHQYPLGNTMDMQRREHCIEHAAACGAYIIENDCDSEFTYGNNKLPSIQGLSDNDNVIYISSVSRVMSPNVRLAYMVIPKHLVNTYMDIFQCYRTAVPVLHQRTLARYIDRGYMIKHIRKLVRSNHNKMQYILNSLQSLESEGYIDICGVPGGGYIAIKCCEREDMALADYCSLQGIGLHKEHDYYLIGYLSINEADIVEASEKLYRIIKEYCTCNKN